MSEIVGILYAEDFDMEVCEEGYMIGVWKGRKAIATA